MIGPMSGETSIAPMMTAAELTFSPSEAIIVAKISTQRFVPRNSTPRQIMSTVSSCRALSSERLKRSARSSRRLSHHECRAGRPLCCRLVSLSFIVLFVFGFVAPRLSRLGTAGDHQHELAARRVGINFLVSSRDTDTGRSAPNVSTNCSRHFTTR